MRVVRHDPYLMGTIRSFLGLALVLAGCSHRSPPQALTPDERLRHGLTGTWTNPWTVMVLEPDGSFWEHGETHTHPMRVWAYEGLWTATNSVLVFMCTN